MVRSRCVHRRRNNCCCGAWPALVRLQDAYVLCYLRMAVEATRFEGYRSCCGTAGSFMQNVPPFLEDKMRCHAVRCGAELQGTNAAREVDKNTHIFLPFNKSFVLRPSTTSTTSVFLLPPLYNGARRQTAKCKEFAKQDVLSTRRKTSAARQTRLALE